MSFWFLILPLVLGWFPCFTCSLPRSGSLNPIVPDGGDPGSMARDCPGELSRTADYPQVRSRCPSTPKRRSGTQHATAPGHISPGTGVQDLRYGREEGDAVEPAWSLSGMEGVPPIFGAMNTFHRANPPVVASYQIVALHTELLAGNIQPRKTLDKWDKIMYCTRKSQTRARRGVVPPAELPKSSPSVT